MNAFPATDSSRVSTVRSLGLTPVSLLIGRFSMPTPAPPVLAESWIELPDGRLFWLKGRCTVGRNVDNDVALGTEDRCERLGVAPVEGIGGEFLFFGLPRSLASTAKPPA